MLANRPFWPLPFTGTTTLILPVATFTFTASKPHSIEHQITSLHQVVLLDVALVYRWPNGPTALGVMAVACPLQNGFRQERQMTMASG